MGENDIKLSEPFGGGEFNHLCFFALSYSCFHNNLDDLWIQEYSMEHNGSMIRYILTNQC